MFNSNNLHIAKEHFNQHRWCVIDNILEDTYIQDLYKFVPQLNYGWWGCYHAKHQKFSYEQTQTLNEAGLRNEYKHNAQDNFGYWHRAYWLLEDHHLNHPAFPLSTEFNHAVMDKQFLDVATEVSGFTNMYTDHPTYSVYDHTSWLKPHHDPARWLAYVFYFNETWQPFWGGQLCIMNEDERSVRDYIEPTGNRLLLMDVSELAGHRINKHFISAVNYTAPHPRYSLAGWFYQRDADGPTPRR